MHRLLFLLSCFSRARERCSNIHPLIVVVAVLLELLCLCALIFVALIRWQVLYLSTLILRLSVPLLCVRVKSLIHLKDAKCTPESIDAHSFTNVSIPGNILMLPA